MSNKIVSADEEVIEIILDDKKIKEIKEQLDRLEKEKEHIHIKLNKNQQMIIHHEKDELI